MTAAARVVHAAETFPGHTVGVRGPVGNGFVILRPHRLVGEDHRQRSSRRMSPINSRNELRYIFFAAGRGAGSSGATTCEVGLEIILRKRYAGRYAVDHDADLRAVRLAPQRYAEIMSETIHERIFWSSSKKRG